VSDGRRSLTSALGSYLPIHSRHSTHYASSGPLLFDAAPLHRSLSAGQNSFRMGAVNALAMGIRDTSKRERSTTA
jgi:hypothetical protein